MAQPATEIHLRECKPGACVEGCAYFVPPAEKPPEREHDLIDNCQDAAKLLWDMATTPPDEPDIPEKAASRLGGILRLLGVGK